jgi:uncharacterized protein
VNVRGRGAIDCDVHANVPDIGALVPHLDDYWQDMVEVRGIGGFESRSYPPLAPLSCRPDWRTAAGRPAEDLATLRAQVLDRWQTRIAILNCLYGVQLIMDEHMAAAFAGSVNDWLVPPSFAVWQPQPIRVGLQSLDSACWQAACAID